MAQQQQLSISSTASPPASPPGRGQQPAPRSRGRKRCLRLQRQPGAPAPDAFPAASREPARSRLQRGWLRRDSQRRPSLRGSGFRSQSSELFHRTGGERYSSSPRQVSTLSSPARAWRGKAMRRCGRLCARWRSKTGSPPAAMHELAQRYSVLSYTNLHPEILPASATRLIEDRNLKSVAVSTCFARTRTYPGGVYWVGYSFMNSAGFRSRNGPPNQQFLPAD